MIDIGLDLQRAFDEGYEKGKAYRPQGEWIPCTKSGLPLTELMRREGQKWYGYRCTDCNYIYKGNALTECNFCPNCGARMVSESADRKDICDRDGDCDKCWKRLHCRAKESE